MRQADKRCCDRQTPRRHQRRRTRPGRRTRHGMSASTRAGGKGRGRIATPSRRLHRRAKGAARRSTASRRRRQSNESGMGASHLSPSGSAAEPRRRDEPREGRRQQPRAFVSAAAPREGQGKRRRATPILPRHGEAGGSVGGKTGGEARGAPTSCETKTRRPLPRESGNFVFLFFCVFRFLRSVNFFVCSENLAMFWCESFTLNGSFLCIFARIFLAE